MKDNNIIHELNKIRQTKIQVQLQGAFPQCVKLPVNQESLLFFLQSQRARPLKQASKFPLMMLDNNIKKFKLTISQAPARELVQSFTPLSYQQKQSLFQSNNYRSFQPFKRSYSPQELKPAFEGKSKIIPCSLPHLKKPQSLSPLLQRHEKESQIQKILLKSTKCQQSKKYDLKLPQIRELLSSQSQSLLSDQYSEKFSEGSGFSSNKQNNLDSNIFDTKITKGSKTTKSKARLTRKELELDTSFSMWDQNEYEDLQSLHHLHSKEQLIFHNIENSLEKSISSRAIYSGSSNSNSKKKNRHSQDQDGVPEYQINLNSLIYESSPIHQD